VPLLAVQATFALSPARTPLNEQFILASGSVAVPSYVLSLAVSVAVIAFVVMSAVVVAEVELKL